jgi:hypothetical protein
MPKHSIRTGLSYGLTFASITTLGLMVGLHAGTNSQLVVIGCILILVKADALGIHILVEPLYFFIWPKGKARDRGR